jgi:hypothetical protein
MEQTPIGTSGTGCSERSRLASTRTLSRLGFDRHTSFRRTRELTGRVPNSWFAEWLQTNYLPVIQDVLREIERPGLSVEFVHERAETRSLPEATVAPPSGPSQGRLRLIRRRCGIVTRMAQSAILIREVRRFILQSIRACRGDGGRGAAVPRL